MCGLFVSAQPYINALCAIADPTPALRKQNPGLKKEGCFEAFVRGKGVNTDVPSNDEDDKGKKPKQSSLAPGALCATARATTPACAPLQLQLQLTPILNCLVLTYLVRSVLFKSISMLLIAYFLAFPTRVRSLRRKIFSRGRSFLEQENGRNEPWTYC